MVFCSMLVVVAIFQRYYQKYNPEGPKNIWNYPNFYSTYLYRINPGEQFLNRNSSPKASYLINTVSENSLVRLKRKQSIALPTLQKTYKSRKKR